MKLSSSEILQAVQAVRHTLKQEVVPGGYSIDSRTLSEGECFVAIRGKNFDGHQFIPDALNKGASLVIAESASQAAEGTAPLILVDDTLAALQKLAHYARQKWGKRIIGITGSTGKTTAKEITALVLGSKFQVFKSIGNFNNHYGLPLSLLKLEARHDIAVMELGMSAAGEIARLSEIAEPDIGIVTNVRPVHLEFFKTMEGIARAKRELIEALPEDGTAILNSDDVRVRKFARAFRGKVLTYGVEAVASYRALEVVNRGLQGCHFILEHHRRSYLFGLPLLGIHNVHNCLPAISAGHHLGLEFNAIADAMTHLKPLAGWGEALYFADGFVVINDSYNSNPASLKAMIDLLKSIPDYRRKILFAGEMLELGLRSPDFHRKGGTMAAKANIDLILGVQGHASYLIEAAKANGVNSSRAIFFDDTLAAAAWLSREVRSGDLVLVKGSRGVKTELAIERLRADHPQAWGAAPFGAQR